MLKERNTVNSWFVSNMKGELFGEDRLLALLNKKPNLSPEEIIYNIENEIKDFTGKSTQQQDDATLLLLTWKCEH